MNITEAQLAERFQITPRKAADMRRAKNWPHLRLGSTIRYTPDQVEEIERSLTVRERPTSEASAYPGAMPGQTAKSAAQNGRRGIPRLPGQTERSARYN